MQVLARVAPRHEVHSVRNHDPTTRAELQEAVDLAVVCLMIDSARQYGLVTGGPAVHVDRCTRIIQRGRKAGVFPAADALERILPAFLHQAAGEASPAICADTARLGTSTARRSRRPS